MTTTPTTADLLKRIESLEKETVQLRANMASGTRSAPADTAYSTDDVSDMIGKFIEEFNAASLAKDYSVAYMISNVDLDLKIQIVKDGSEYKMKNADPGQDADTLQSIKFSVKPIPNARQQ